jgi:hypothetical protein
MMEGLETSPEAAEAAMPLLDEDELLLAKPGTAHDDDDDELVILEGVRFPPGTTMQSS